MGGKKEMKRILGTVAALSAVLAFSTVSSAAVINFDVSAVGGGGDTSVGCGQTAGGCLQTGSTLAPAPGWFTTGFATGSTVSVETDTNGDGILGQAGDVSFLTGSLHIAGTTDLGAYGTFLSDVTVAMSGGQGTLSGEDILWYSSVGTNIASTGTFGCTGAICGLIGITEGVVYPISVYDAFVAAQGVTALSNINLGFWNISSGNILGSSMAVTAVTAAGGPASWYLFGNNNLGPAPVPEPGTFALVLLGIGGLALRSRKA
jgi:PEP-CTERM motif